MITSIAYRICVLVLFLTSLYGCSELKNNAIGSNPTSISVHPQAFKSPSSPDFHGNTVRNAGWEMRDCRQCHGGTYSGSNAISCMNSGCHMDASGNPKSPESCNTCHGNFAAAANDTVSWAPPSSIDGDTSSSARGVGAHQSHLNGSAMVYAEPLPCNTCHRVPSNVYDVGHVDSQGPAEVTFVDLRASTPSGGLVPAPSYDANSMRCSNTYCHGNWRVRKGTSANQFAYSDSVITGNNYSVLWNGGVTEAACGTCHGMPPTGHVNFGTSVSTCTSCHYLDPATRSGSLDKSTHMNGKVDLFGSEYAFK